MITEANQATEIIESGKADLVLFAREALRDPYFPQRFAFELGQDLQVPIQYERGKLKRN